MHRGLGQGGLLGKTDLQPLKPGFGDVCFLGSCMPLSEPPSRLWQSQAMNERERRRKQCPRAGCRCSTKLKLCGRVGMGVFQLSTLFLRPVLELGTEDKRSGRHDMLSGTTVPPFLPSPNSPEPSDELPFPMAPTLPLRLGCSHLRLQPVCLRQHMMRLGSLFISSDGAFSTSPETALPV